MPTMEQLTPEILALINDVQAAKQTILEIGEVMSMKDASHPWLGTNLQSKESLTSCFTEVIMQLEAIVKQAKTLLASETKMTYKTFLTNVINTTRETMTDIAVVAEMNDVNL